MQLSGSNSCSSNIISFLHGIILNAPNQQTVKTLAFIQVLTLFLLDLKAVFFFKLMKQAAPRSLQLLIHSLLQFFHPEEFQRDRGKPILFCGEQTNISNCQFTGRRLLSDEFSGKLLKIHVKATSKTFLGQPGYTVNAPSVSQKETLQGQKNSIFIRDITEILCFPLEMLLLEKPVTAQSIISCLETCCLTLT